MRTLAIAFCLGLLGCSPQPPVATGTMPALDGKFDFATLALVNDAGERLEFDVYVARSFEQHRRGLMFVRDMPETTGMLFVYDDDAIRSIWMKNTYISLDILFARNDGSVALIDEEATPLTLDSRSSTVPVRYVLELNAGTTRRLGIGKASRLLWGIDEQE